MSEPAAPRPLAELQEALGYRFRDEQLLQLALTHPSAAREQGAAAQHNQRLEFLGDAVLQVVLTVALYQRFPEAGEGPLTKARAKLVNRRALADQGNVLRLGTYLSLSRGEEMHGGRERASAIADAFEAVVGAIYLDAGIEAAREFIARAFRGEFEGLTSVPNVENPKGELQEKLQATSAIAPVYVLKMATGPDHDRLFECAVNHLGVELGRGQGKSKKAAESQAALAALENLRAAAEG